MKTITFRPLRRIKKTGKIAVASYTGWYRVMTSDYNKFNLIILDDYKKMPPDEYVYNHEGKQLYFFTYNPADVPVYNSATMDLEALHASKEPYGIIWQGSDAHTSYHMDGTDCVGCPTFTHWDEDRITQEDTWKYYGHEKFEPLTVGTVVMWFGWFLYQLNNSYLQIGK